MTTPNAWCEWWGAEKTTPLKLKIFRQMSWCLNALRSTASLDCFYPKSRSGELRTQKLKSHLVRTQSLNVLPLKPGIGQYIAIHATLTARDFFFAYFYPSGPFTCIFPKPLPISPVLAVVNTWFLCRPAEQVTLLDAGSRVECPQNVNRLKKNN